MKILICSKCGDYFDKKSARRGVQCQDCIYHTIKLRINGIQDVYFTRLLASAKISAQDRLAKGRTLAGVFELTLHDLKRQFDIQQEKCYYSKVPLVLKVSSDWMCSLERLDPSKGYTMDNVVLVAAEFNGSDQWTICKFAQFIQLLKADHERRTVDFNPPKRARGCVKVQRTVVSGVVTHAQCNKCGLTKTIDAFNKDVGLGCKACTALYDKARSETSRGHLTKLLKSMKLRAKKQTNMEPCTLELQDMIEIFGRQGGLCAYSKIPLTFGSYFDNHWTCSPERIDNSIGYTKDNLCFIIHELNTSVQWSHDKLQYMLSFQVYL